MVKNPPANAGCAKLDPSVGKILWSIKQQLAPIFLPGKFYGQRSLAAAVHGVTKSRTRLSTHTHTHTHTHTLLYSREADHRILELEGNFEVKLHHFTDEAEAP